MRKLAFGLVVGLTWVAAAATNASAVQIEDILISGKRIVIKDNVVAAKRKAAFVSKDDTLNVTGLDPSVGGATFYLVDPFPGQQSSIFQMPASNWMSKNGKYTYTDKGLVHGPVKKAKLKNGLLKIVLKGSEIDFPVFMAAPLGEVGGVLTVSTIVGQMNICFLFPGDDGVVKKDSPVKGVYKAVKAESPEFCPSIIVP